MNPPENNNQTREKPGPKKAQSKKKKSAPELIPLTKKSADIPLNQRKRPEPGQRTICELANVNSGCLERKSDEPPKKKKKVDADECVIETIPPILKSGIPFIQDVQYVISTYKGYETGVVLHGLKDGQTLTLTKSMLNDMIRNIRSQK